MSKLTTSLKNEVPAKQIGETMTTSISKAMTKSIMKQDN